MLIPHQSYLDRDEDAGMMTAEERLPAGWAALSILGLSLAGWGVVALAIWLS